MYDGGYEFRRFEDPSLIYAAVSEEELEEHNQRIVAGWDSHATRQDLLSGIVGGQ